MRVRVKILRPLSDLAGTGDTPVELPPRATMRQLLAVLAERYPKLGEEILPDGKDAGLAFAAIRNEVLMSAEELDRELAEGDDVTLFAPITGGSR